MEEKYKNAFSEVYCIIENMHPDNRRKINSNFIKFLEKVKNHNYKPDPQKINLLLKENLMKETKIILSIIYEKNFK